MTDNQEPGLRWREDNEAECGAGHVIVPLSMRARSLLLRTGRCPRCGAPVDLDGTRRRSVVYVDSPEEAAAPGYR